MVNVKSTLKGLLIGDSALTALVPAGRILSAWPDSFADLPLINFRELDSFTVTESMFDNMPIADNSSVEIQIWNKPGTSCTAIFAEVNRIMEAASWNRDYAEDFVDPTTKYARKVCRYSAVLYR